MIAIISSKGSLRLLLGSGDVETYFMFLVTLFEREGYQKVGVNRWTPLVIFSNVPSTFELYVIKIYLVIQKTFLVCMEAEMININ